MERQLAVHLGVQMTLRDLARRLGYSQSYVCEVVQRLMGKRFTAIRRELRLATALAYLRRGTSIKAAALEAGFSDPAYFTRVFRRAYGVPPSGWRRVGRRAASVDLETRSGTLPPAASPSGALSPGAPPHETARSAASFAAHADSTPRERVACSSSGVRGLPRRR
jgi:AraC-like DNA-binding protein